MPTAPFSSDHAGALFINEVMSVLHKHIIISLANTAASCETNKLAKRRTFAYLKEAGQMINLLRSFRCRYR
jgi:hypothetical protein